MTLKDLVNGVDADITVSYDNDGGRNNKNLDTSYRDKEWLKEKYIVEDLKQSEIADICNTDHGVIYRWLRKFKLKSEKRSNEKCPECGVSYTNLSNHWKASKCSPPELTNRQHEIMTGLMMSDGSIHRSGRQNPSVAAQMTNLPFLKWLYDEMGIYSSSINVQKPSDWSKHKLYSYITKRHHAFDKYDWMFIDHKMYPEWVGLTPMILKIWYCGDGGVWWKNGEFKGIQIGAMNESWRTDYLKSLFGTLDFKVSVAKNGHIHIYENDATNENNATKMLEYMGDPPDGFEYKWCIDDREKYLSLMSNVKTPIE